MTYKISLSSVRIPRSAVGLIADAFGEELVGHSKYVERFEEMLADYLGARYCVAVSNGTMADAVAVCAIKELYRIKRVVVPALTFIAQPNSVRYNGLDVLFCDVRMNWLMDTRYPHINSDTLYFATDLMGRVIVPEDYSGLLMIEDACEAFGSKRDGQAAGTLGLCGTYSFFPSHTISTGEGGAIVTNDEHIFRACQSMRAHGSASSDPMNKFTFPHFGYNARMTTMQACLGIALMQDIQKHVQDRRAIFLMMQKRLGGFVETHGEFIIPHGFPIEFVSTSLRDEAMTTILEAGIECRKFFSCIPTSEMQYRSLANFPIAQHIASTHLYLPCHQNMSDDDVEYIGNIVDDLKGRVL